MKGWGTDGSTLVRLLSGLDGSRMASVSAAYQRKYDKPLASALRAELSGDFRRAALAWIRALQV